MVEMVLVREERVAAFAYAVEDDSHHVKQRDQQCRERYDHIPGCIIPGVGREAQAEHQEAENIAQCQAACIPHKKLMALEFIPEDIVEPERDDDPQSSECQQGVDVVVPEEQHHAEYSQRYAAQA